MKPATALILRGVGLLIEVIGLSAFVSLRDDPRTVAGIELRQIALAAVVLGFLLWLASIAARRVGAKPRREPD
jgi:hypothetical protein